MDEFEITIKTAKCEKLVKLTGRTGVVIADAILETSHLQSELRDARALKGEAIDERNAAEKERDELRSRVMGLESKLAECRNSIWPVIGYWAAFAIGLFFGWACW